VPRRSRSARQRRPRKLSPRFIVACEGRKTEYNYFSVLNQRFTGRLRAALVPVADTGGTAVDVVTRASRKRDADERDGKFRPSEGDRVYAILDVEPHDASKAQPLSDALQLAQKEGVRVLLSNPSFEVWLLCHVAEASELRRVFWTPSDADALLKKKSKGGKEELNRDTRRYATLLAKVHEAVTVAREVHEKHHGNCADLRKANACTEVYRLVGYLLGQTDTAP